MTNNQFQILIKSIGTAQPAASAAVAKGLGLPVSTVIARLYSAPAILVDGISESIAKQMVKLLSSIGYEAEAQTRDTPAPKASPLYDVVVYIEDARQFQHSVQTVAKFTGINEDDASQMILSPPGVVLGSVSKATVHALEKQLSSGVSVLASQPSTGLYHLFLSKDEGGMIQQRILEDIRAAKVDLCATSGLVAMQVEHKLARDLWQRHQASGLLRIVNEDFLRFDLVLQQTIQNQTAQEKELYAKQSDVLNQIAGIPVDMVEDVLQAAPITLLESVPNAQVTKIMTAFAEVGLTVQADLITFQMLGLEVVALPTRVDRQQLIQTLEGFGLHDKGAPLARPPFRLPGVMPELQARIIQAALEDLGAEVAYVEVSE